MLTDAPGGRRMACASGRQRLEKRHALTVANGTVGAAGAATLRCDAYPLRAAPDVRRVDRCEALSGFSPQKDTDGADALASAASSSSRECVATSAPPRPSSSRPN